jgi:predicted porin
MQINRAQFLDRRVIANPIVIACVFAVIGFASAANADDIDLGRVKDMLPKTTAGVTVYGAIDVGYAYQSHGTPLNGADYTGLNTIMFGAKASLKPISTLSEDGLSQSFIGIKVEEALYENWRVIAKAESGFVPLSGEIADNCASLARNNGKDLFHQNTNGDGSRCGQFFNGPLYAGVSNPGWGTLTIGRQNTLVSDVLGEYDPMGLSYAFSLLGLSGTAGGGAGDTESLRRDNSLKYIYKYSLFHGGAMYAQGGEDNSLHGFGAAGNLGVTWGGFSIDAVFTKEKSAIASALLPATGPGSVVEASAAGFEIDKTLNATVSDNTAWTVAAKYTFDVDSCCVSLKDSGPSDKLTLYAGYKHLDFANPTDPVFDASGVFGPNAASHANDAATTIGGYYLFSVNNFAYTTNKVYNVAWAGPKYDFNWGLSLAAAYYYLNQNSYVRNGVDCAHAALPTVGIRTATQCSGNFNMGAFLADYAFNKYFDVYGGVNYSTVDGGLASGFLTDNSFLFMTGVRLRF